jgi:hypothetical protein
MPGGISQYLDALLHHADVMRSSDAASDSRSTQLPWLTAARTTSGGLP